ncbi:hypothetical protein BJX63DRAFT_397924 [Aspergillus granulosus]|uniref:Protein kinase domain-containing protein n=1 Tax=Aspergillus granulosus TaxID=176169 RepID=A0ABR4H8R3_9EURO
MALGCSGVEAFQNARRYKIRGFELYSFHQGTGPSTAVEDWLTKLQDSSTQTCILLVLLARKLLQMDQLKRPTATEVTLLLRRAALCAVAITVQDLFRRIRAAADSIDLYLEAVKFESWRYAIGIMNVEDAVQPRSAQRCDMSQFDAILDALFALRRDLESRTSTDRTQRVTMSQLLRLNNDLYLFLGRTDRDAFHEYFNLTVAERDDEIFQPSERMEMGIIVDEEIRMRATIRHINKLLDSGSVSNSDEMRVELSHVLLRQRFGQHHIAQFTGDQKSRPVWVEWRGYGRHGVDEEVQAQLYRRTAKLAELLSQEKPPTLRTLDCCGFFHDPTRVAFGLIFDIPSASTSWDSFEPVSLFDIIEASTDRLSRSPDLDDKFDLATSLATSLLELHTVGWFHKGLTSSNIVFFSEKGTQKHSIREPFLVGFNHSRSDEHNTFTTGLTDSSSKDYQHPRYIKESFGYRHEFDYYSLGIILMEIGFWKPLNQLVSSPKYLNMSYEQRRQSLLTYRVPHLKQYMGREFYQAVKWCIEGDTGISDTQESRDKAVPLAFQEQVVSRLRGRFMTNAKRD